MPNKPYYPTFSEDILILFKNTFGLDPKANKKLTDNFSKHNLNVSVVNYEPKFDKFERAYNNNASVNIFINGSFNKLNGILLNQFVIICAPIILFLASALTNNNVPGLIVFTEVLNKKLRFNFDFKGSLEEFKVSLYNALITIENFKKKNQVELDALIVKHFNPNDSCIHFAYKNKVWKVSDPLAAKIETASDEYKKGKDFRINKPTVIINENSHSELFTFENKWTLHFDNKFSNMYKPNDVSLYSNISEINLIEAKVLYEKIIDSNNYLFLDAFYDNDLQKIYFAYFEKIIQSIIAAFTSVEALLNLCIRFEEDYEWKRTDEVHSTLKKYKGDKIERFPFKEKIKFITFTVLMKSQKEFDKLYSVINELKIKRDEIIHAKPSKSEDRYSNFLKADIFSTIDSHKVFIKIMGKYISENAKYLLNDFPYNFGQDEFFPSPFTDEESIQLFNEIHRPSSSGNPSMD